METKIKIPTRLQNLDFRFVLLGKWNVIRNKKTKVLDFVTTENYKKIKDSNEWDFLGKAPFESAWQKNGYKFSDIKLLNHKDNFGVIGGYGNLRILDIDNKELAEEFEEKLNTYTVKTGSGGRHFYFISDYNTNHVLIKEIGELRARNYQVVSAPCRHPSSNYYEIVNDVPIQTISKEDLLNLIKPYLREENQTIETKTYNKKEDTSRSGLEYRKVLALLREGKTREEIYKIMNAYSKWASSTEQYRTLTFEKAENFYLQEQESKQSKENVLIPTEEILKILKDPELLETINKEFDKKIVGEEEARKVIFINANMRNVENLNKGTDNLIINAVSGTGKDYITESIYDIIPDNEKEELIRTTPKVLAYTRNINKDKNATWKKTTLRMEDVSENVINDDSFKVFLSANPNKINIGKTMIKQKVVEIAIEGKPSITMTLANPIIRDEGLRRCPNLFLDEGINQTKEILKRQGQFAKEGKIIEYNEDIREALKFLKRVKVKIPYADLLIKVFENSTQNVIVRTAFPRFLDYIKSSCSLYQFQRQKDENNSYIAEKQDYEIGSLCLRKTTSNLLMIPLIKLDSRLYDFFKEHKDYGVTIDELMDFEEIQVLGKSDRWIRFRLDFLVSKGFLKRSSEHVQGSFKPVNKYHFKEVGEFNIPSFEELIINTPYEKELKETSNTSNDANTTNTSKASNTKKEGAFEVFEVNETKSSIHSFLSSEQKIKLLEEPLNVN